MKTNTVNEQSIRQVRSSDGRTIIKVIVLSYSAAGKLANVVRADGQGTGATFTVWAKDIL